MTFNPRAAAQPAPGLARPYRSTLQYNLCNDVMDVRTVVRTQKALKNDEAEMKPAAGSSMTLADGS